MLSLDKQNAWREHYRQRRPEWRPATEVYAELVQQQLRPSSRILDIGCGRGGLVEQLHHPLRQTVGLDPDWQSLWEHRLALPRVAAVSHALPFTAGAFDLAFASWVLEHLAVPASTFAAVSRALKPGGVFVFITPNGRHPLALLNRLLGRAGWIQARTVQRVYGRVATDTFPTFYRANSRAAIEKLGKQSGLVLESFWVIPDPTYLAFNPAFFRLACRLEERLPPSRQLHLVGLARRS